MGRATIFLNPLDTIAKLLKEDHGRMTSALDLQIVKFYHHSGMKAFQYASRALENIGFGSFHAILMN